MGKEKVVWVVLLLLCCGGGVVECLEEERERVVVVSMLLGCITGCVSALLCASLLSFILRYINTPPLLKGPVVFSPLLLSSSSSPKSLQSALQTLTHTHTHNNTLLLDNGFTVSVYKFQLQPRLPSLNNNNKKKKNMMRRIQRELHILASLRHSCLLPLLAYHVTTTTTADDDHTTFYLVYDYLPTATTLQDAIIGSGSRLPWDARLRIAVGIIKALHYLHLSCSPPLLHYHLHPSNVLLDAHFQPRLLPLSRLANTFHPLTTTSTSVSPPECFPNFSIYTQKSDIFSFGVILGMLLTGRDPNDPLFGSGMGTWFRQVVEAGDAREALDKTLLGQEMEEDQMLMAVRIAAVCLSDMPLDRPSTDELLPMLTQLHSF